jgi:hypothetical protein
MTEAFRICIIVPPGYRHSMCFVEAGFLLKHSLGSLGQNCDIALNDLSRDRINIILGWHLMQHNEGLAPFRYIPYQLEQLSVASWNTFPENGKMILSRALDVWDYSPENIAFLKNHGIAARHVPVGYHESLEQIPQHGEKDIDILFYGSICERRRAVLESLSKDTGTVVRSLFDVYGKERDECIGRSRIILNIHYYEAQILEAIRLSYLLNNRCFVISEFSEINPYKKVKIPMFPYADLAPACRRYLTDKEGMDSLREACYREFKGNYPMTAVLKDALEPVNFYA